MDFRFTEEQEAFRQEVTSWLEQTLHEVRGGDTPRSFESMAELEEGARDFQKRLFEAGFQDCPDIPFPQSFVTDR